MIDFFATHLWQVWLCVSLVCLLLELSSGDFFIMCFSIGALVTTVGSALGLGFYGQLLVFAISSTLCLCFVRPVALKYLNHNRNQRMSNADALIDRVGIVSEDIVAGGYGRVAIDGDDWKAEAATNGESFAKGEKVKVTDRESIIIKVEKA